MTRATAHVRGALALGLVVALALVVSGCSGDDSDATRASTVGTEPAAAGGRIATGFERDSALDLGDFARVTLTGRAAHTGSGGLEMRPTASDAYLRLGPDVLGETHPFWTFRAWMRIAAWTPGESVDLFTVRNLAARHNFDLFVGAPGREIRWDLFREDAAAAAPLELNRWYLVEAKGSFATSTFTADVRIDGIDQPSIASPGQQPSAVKDFILGSIGTVKTHRAQFDDVAVELGDAPLPFLGAVGAVLGAPAAGAQP